MKKVNEYCEFVFEGQNGSLRGNLQNYKNFDIILAVNMRKEMMRLGS